MHLIFEGVPSVSVEEYAFAILNNTRYWMEKKYAGVLKETGLGMFGDLRITRAPLGSSQLRR